MAPKVGRPTKAVTLTRLERILRLALYRGDMAAAMMVTAEINRADPMFQDRFYF
jgi:hypothetical protein